MTADDARAERLRQLELIRKADAEWQTQAARHEFLSRFERDADPLQQLGEEERQARAVALRREHMRGLAAKSAAARAERVGRIGHRPARRGGARASRTQQAKRGASRRLGHDGSMKPSRRLAPKLVGLWRITEMDGWDQDAVDLIGSAIIKINADRTGIMRFIAVEAELDHRPAQRDGRPALEFTWDGNDEGSPVNGRGWVALAGDDAVEGHVWFHMGDDSGLRAVRMAVPAGGSW